MMLRVIDLETTGAPPEADVVEAAFVNVKQVEEAWQEVGEGQTFVRAERPVEVEARAAHHIADQEIARGADWRVVGVRLKAGADALVAHNAAFERAFIDDDVPWICTYKAALRLWPDAPRHSNQVLRYYLDCDPGEAGMPPHRALPDCKVTARILMRCLERASVEELIEWSSEPALLPRIPFGKHRGSKWSEVPFGYLSWASRQDFDEDVAHCIRTELDRRKT